jgi:hypothetical protein
MNMHICILINEFEFEFDSEWQVPVPYLKNRYYL